MKTVIPCRISEAREARALSMGELASYVDLTRQSISKFERGIIKPSFEMINKIADTLYFPIDFFYKEETVSTAQKSSLFFRSNANIAKKTKIACKYQLKWTNDIKIALERYVDFIKHDLTTIDINYEDLSCDDIENLAINLRKHWGLDDGPIIDLVGLLENHGIIIAQFSESKYCKFSGIEAFSAWQNGTPFIVYNKIQKSAVRTRFSILHELGHLIMHSSISEEDSLKKEIIDFADRQADYFAAAFLLPASSFSNDIINTSIHSIKILKKKWLTSMSAIIKRCKSLKILSDNQLDYLNRQMSVNKYWHKEPFDDILTIQGPEMIRDAIFMLIDNNIITKNNFMEMIAINTYDLQSICNLPNDFFVVKVTRQKPIIKVIK